MFERYNVRLLLTRPRTYKCRSRRRRATIYARTCRPLRRLTSQLTLDLTLHLTMRRRRDRRHRGTRHRQRRVSRCVDLLTCRTARQISSALTKRYTRVRRRMVCQVYTNAIFNNYLTYRQHASATTRRYTTSDSCGRRQRCGPTRVALSRPDRLQTGYRIHRYNAYAENGFNVTRRSGALRSV